MSPCYDYGSEPFPFCKQRPQDAPQGGRSHQYTQDGGDAPQTGGGNLSGNQQPDQGAQRQGALTAVASLALDVAFQWMFLRRQEVKL